MGIILAYALQSAITMTILYLVYKWLLSSETFHAVNRGVILAIYGISCIAPVLFPFIAIPTTEGVTTNSNMLSALAAMATETTATQSTTPIWLVAILYTYIAGILIMTGRLIYTGIRIARIIRNGEKISCHDYIAVITDDIRIAPFSWGRYMVMNRTDYQQSEQAITVHEARHIACRHWIDLLIAETGLIFNWFSPAAWLLKDELRTVHEYQADMAVLHSGADARSYQLLLISKAVGNKFPSLANSLNHSKLKKRIAMMIQPKSSKYKAWRALVFVPASAVIVLLINMPAVASAFERIGSGSLIQSKPQPISIVEDDAPVIIMSEPIHETGVGTQLNGNVVNVSRDSSTTTVNHTYQPSSSPAIFIGNKRIANDDLNSIDPSTIESMTVTKSDPDYPDGAIYITLKPKASTD